MGIATGLRADLTAREHPVPRAEFLWITTGAFLTFVVAGLSNDVPTGLAAADRAGLDDAAIIAVAAAAFLLRGTRPRIPDVAFAALVIGPIWIVTSRPGAPYEGAFFMSVVMVLSVAAGSRSHIRWILITAVGATYPYLVSLAQDGTDDIGWIAWTSAHVFTAVLGRVMRTLQDVIAELDATRAALAEQAVAEERRRIARDLHDVAGHTLAAVMLHVTGARHVLRRDPDEAERALLDAEAVGRTSLDQIRATVEALRTTESGTDPTVATGADVNALVDEYRRAGLDVDADLGRGTDDVDGPTGTALHRIVREALSNVARHAPTNRVEVHTEVTPDAVAVTVADHGTCPAPTDPSGTHFGLTGMRERARSVGGDVEAGPDTDGWRVAARLPRVAGPA